MVILTTEANNIVRALHDRMLVILQPEFFDLWLDVINTPADEAVELLRPASDDFLEVRAVSRAVNNPRNDAPEVQATLKGEHS